MFVTARFLGRREEESPPYNPFETSAIGYSQQRFIQWCSAAFRQGDHTVQCSAVFCQQYFSPTAYMGTNALNYWALIRGGCTAY